MGSYTCVGDHKLQRCFPESCYCVGVRSSCNRGDRYVQGALPENGLAREVKRTFRNPALYSVPSSAILSRSRGKNRLLGILVQHNSFLFLL
jgi:hypothetical protein